MLDLEGVVLVGQADERAGVAAAQRGRVDSGVLQCLPGDFQQQPLLRVHRQRLARTDPEEAGVEPGRVVEEAAVAGVRGAGPVRVRVEQPGNVPPTVGGEVRHRVPACGHQVPQRLGGGDPAGVPAAHAHDRDGFLRCGCRHHGRGTVAGRAAVLLVPEQFGGDVPGQCQRRRLVEHHRGREPQAGRPVEAVADFHSGQRVQAEILEVAPGVHAAGRLVPEDGGGLAAYQFHEGLVPLRAAERGEPLDQRRAGRLLLGVASALRLGQLPRLGDALQQGPRAGRGEREEQPVPVDVRDDQACLVLRHGQPEGVGRPLGRHPEQAVAAEQGFHRAVFRHAAARPGAPRHGCRREPFRPAAFGQRVQVGVRRCVAALSWCAQRSGDRGEQHERAQRQVPGQFVEMVRGAGLDPQYAVDLVRCQGFQGVVVEDGRRVHDRGERVFGGYGVQDGGERGPVRDVAGDDRRVGARGGQFGGQFVRAGRVRAGPADQDQAVGAVGRQPAGELPDPARRCRR